MTPRPSLSIGIEEEYQIVDPETRELRSYITEFIDNILDGYLVNPESPQTGRTLYFNGVLGFQLTCSRDIYNEFSCLHEHHNFSGISFIADIKK